MAVTIHALLLLIVPVVTIIICLVGPRQKSLKPAQAAFIAGGTALLGLLFSAHLCDAGNPFVQCIVISASMWILLTCSGSKRIRIGLSAVMLVIMVGLCIQYVNLVHSKAWYGHPYPPFALNVLNQSRLSDIRGKLKGLGLAGAAYPEGWLQDTPFVAALKEQLEHKPLRFEAHRAWHSWFTRLFPLQRIEQDYWFPGGRLPESADSITLKDRS